MDHDLAIRLIKSLASHHESVLSEYDDGSHAKDDRYSPVIDPACSICDLLVEACEAIGIDPASILPEPYED